MPAKRSPLMKITVSITTVVILFTAAFVVYALSNQTEITYEREEYAASTDGLSGIQVKARNMPVTVKAHEGGEILVTYYTAEEDPYEVTHSGGILLLRNLKEGPLNLGGWFSGLFRTFSDSNPEVVISVPASFAGNITLNTSNAAVGVSGLNAAGHIGATTSNGAVGVTAVSAAGLRVNISNGAVTLENVLVTGATEVRSSNGALAARQVASITRLYLETSNAAIRAYGIASEDITLATSNGSVSGTVAGSRADYTVTSSTSNGRDNLGSGGTGPLRLSARTSNGSIDVGFLEK